MIRNMKASSPNRRGKLLTTAILVLLFFTGCKRELIEEPDHPKNETQTGIGSPSTQRSDFNYQEGPVILGDQLENPYTPDVMARAYENVLHKGISSLHPVDIRETYYYVRFLPQTWDEYDDLKEDTTLSLSDIPYDYDIVQDGNYYHDPNINDSLPTYQYATVPVDFVFNDSIQYEILAPLYVPEEDISLLGEVEENELFVDHLLDEAYKLTHNYGDTLDLSSGRRPKYTPGGNIQLFDTRLNTTYGMEGIKVTARRWFIVYKAHCDFWGNYRMSHRFRRPCNYSAWFEYKRFMVNRAGVHWINGPKQTGDWNHTIADGFDRFAGHIFRAAYRYHYKDIGGLQRPFRWLGRNTIYVAKDDVGTGLNPIWTRRIKIWRFEEEGIEWDSDDIFSTTCHETGHTSHAIAMNTIIQYWQVSRQLQESWAIVIEWFLTHREYADRGIGNYGEWDYDPTPIPNFPNNQAYQYWNISDYSGWYSSLYINIIDNHNELGRSYGGWGTGVVDDQVQDYSLPFIEAKLLKHIYGHASLADELKANKPASVSDDQIDRLLEFY